MFLSAFPEHLIGILTDAGTKHVAIEKLEFEENIASKAKDKGFGVFFTPNGHGRIRNPHGTLFRWDGNVTRLNACFADFDKYSKTEQLRIIQSMPLTPSILVESKRGYHCYWMLDSKTVTNPESISLWRRIQTTIAEKFEADAACKNPSRLMRLPGSYHVKNPDDPFLVAVKEVKNVTYTLSELEIAFPPKPRPLTLATNPKYSKQILIPPFAALYDGNRHPSLLRAAGQMYFQAKPSDDQAIRQALKIWYSMSCVNLKKNWEEEVDMVCDWANKQEFNFK